MIYLKDNKINKFGSNKIYLKDKVIYQAVKKPTIEIPTYLKSAFAYDSFAEDGITDVINNIKYNWGYTGEYSDFQFTVKEHLVNIYAKAPNKRINTNMSSEPILKNYKSILIKCNNMFNMSNNFTIYQYSEINPEFTYISVTKDTINYKNYFLIFSTQPFYEKLKNVNYIYVDFNGEELQSNIIFLDNDYEIIFETNVETFNTSENTGASNSLLYIDFKGNWLNSNYIDFYYQCYCDKFLSIDDIKEIDKYMMQR